MENTGFFKSRMDILFSRFLCISIDLYLEFSKGVKLPIVSDFAKLYDGEDLSVYICIEVEYMSLEELDILSVGTDSRVGDIMEQERECVDTICDDAWSESDIGSRVSDRTTELFAMDDSTGERHREESSDSEELSRGDYIFCISANRFSPERAYPCPIRSST
jgi:hypothetical protein